MLLGTLYFKKYVDSVVRGVQNIYPTEPNNFVNSVRFVRQLCFILKNIGYFGLIGYVSVFWIKIRLDRINRSTLMLLNWIICVQYSFVVGPMYYFVLSSGSVIYLFPPLFFSSSLYSSTGRQFFFTSSLVISFFFQFFLISLTSLYMYIWLYFSKSRSLCSRETWSMGFRSTA